MFAGSEGFGLSDDIRDLCSEFISIPAGRQLHPGIDSLNVSVATGRLIRQCDISSKQISLWNVTYLVHYTHKFLVEIGK